jgi:annexin A7/11
MADALYYIARGAETSQAIERDVEYLYDSMSGMGTKDERLVYRVVRGHWCKPRWEDVKRVYKAKYGKSLASAIKGETSGKYEVSSYRIVASRCMPFADSGFVLQRMLVTLCE